jgi:hypothetical protein
MQLAQVRSILVPSQENFLDFCHSSIEGAERISNKLNIEGMTMGDFDWSLVLLVEDLLVHDWTDNAAYMAHRSEKPDKIVYAPQFKVVLNKLFTLSGEALETYMEQQRRMVQDTLNVLDRVPSLMAWRLTLSPSVVHPEI